MISQIPKISKQDDLDFENLECATEREKSRMIESFGRYALLTNQTTVKLTNSNERGDKVKFLLFAQRGIPGGY